MPSCLGLSGSVRTRQKIMSACAAVEVQIFWPLMTKSSPSSIARVVSEARSDARAGLGIALAPDHLAAQGRADPALLLLLGAEFEQRRHQHGDALVRHAHRQAGGDEFLRDDARFQDVRRRRRSRHIASGSCARHSRARSAAAARRGILRRSRDRAVRARRIRGRRRAPRRGRLRIRASRRGPSHQLAVIPGERSASRELRKGTQV